MAKEINLYDGIFADVYHLYWKEYIDILAPQIVELITNHFDDKIHILDLCCGTGRMSHMLLREGYTVHGLDISPDMIRVAKQSNSTFIKSNQATFSIDDATQFEVNRTYSFIISTFDSLNHLEDTDELRQVFERVFHALSDDGMFVFDLNTAKGLKKWNFVDVEDNEDTVFIMHGGFDKKAKVAYTRVYGFHRVGDNIWNKFDQLFTNRIFKIEKVSNLLNHVGFKKITYHDHTELKTIISEPEKEDRIILIAKK